MNQVVITLLIMFSSVPAFALDKSGADNIPRNCFTGAGERDKCFKYEGPNQAGSYCVRFGNVNQNGSGGITSGCYASEAERQEFISSNCYEQKAAPYAHETQAWMGDGDSSQWAAAALIEDSLKKCDALAGE